MRVDNKIKNNVLELLREGIKSDVEIMSECGISLYFLKGIIVEGKVDTKKRSKKLKKNRTINIYNVIQNHPNLTYEEIGNLFNVSKRTIENINRLHGGCRYEKFPDGYFVELKEKIGDDIKNSVPFKDIKTKYRLDENKITRLRQIGFATSTVMREHRDGEIKKQYKNKIAKKIILDDESELKIRSLSGIYQIACKDGFKKYPGIGDRSKGGTFENEEILKLIEKRKDVDKWTYQRISDELTYLGYKTITGVEFSLANVLYKYGAYKKMKNGRME